MNEHGQELVFDDHERAYRAAAERARTQPANGNATEIQTAYSPQWPEPLTEAAYYGLAGEFVRLVGPHCEGDPAALLAQFLITFGNRVGRHPHYMVEATTHNTNMFACLVGMTSKARKGTSGHRSEQMFLAVEGPGSRDGFVSGLSSGEGLISAVRDANGAPDDEKADQGVSDKRLMVTQGEFCSVLKVMDREGNILSGIIRDAFDKGYLRVMTKKPMKASDAHISILGHITIEELRRSLTETDKANGFANRFLWLCVKRSKSLPEGGDVPADQQRAFVEKLGRRLQDASLIGRMRRDDSAKELWAKVYARLSEGEPGLIGSVIARAEALALRLSCIYALTDGSSLVRLEHLQAALALWKYCDASARFIFGHALGDPVADAILSAVKESPEGLSRTEISDLFGRNKSAAQIQVALNALLERGRIDRVQERTNGRSAEIWVTKETN
jgi:hypothetical protein